VAGGAQAVVMALQAAVGVTGTLAVPTQSVGFTDPSGWTSPAVPAAWWPAIRESTPAFDPARSPIRRMGEIAEAIRHLPGARRTGHPAMSFAAVGRARDAIVGGHELAFGLGEGSPLARLYELDAKVLLLGVGHGNNTSLHLGEHRAEYSGKRTITKRSPLLVDGERRWVAYEELVIDDSDFKRLGDDFGATGAERRGPVGAGGARVMEQRAVVDFAVGWFADHRTAG
jgi:aminoglycoside 3-N-acetyltransferase